MKRIIPLILILFLFTGCKIKEYTPEIPVTFTQRAEICSGDFSFKGEFCKTQDAVILTVLSTSANGMTMTYNGSELCFCYDDYSYSIDGKSFEPSNAAVIIYEVMSDIDNSHSKKIDGGYQYQGRISLGDYTLVQNDDNTFKSIVIKSAGVKINFENQ